MQFKVHHILAVGTNKRFMFIEEKGQKSLICIRIGNELYKYLKTKGIETGQSLRWKKKMRKNIDYKNNNNSDDWAKPKKLYEYFIKNGFKDPCPYKAKFNGLLNIYCNDKLYINPPFSNIEQWVYYAIEQYNNNCEIYLLMPSRTDTKYFHKLLKYCPEIIFFKGRLSFNDIGKKAPFPCILVHLDHTLIHPTYSYLESNDYI